MDRYANYSIQDFIQDPDFIRWVKFPDAASNQYWESVKNRYFNNSDLIDKAANLVANLAVFYPDVPDFEVEKGRQAILERLESPQRFWDIINQNYIRIAASLLILSTIGFWILRGNVRLPSVQNISSRSDRQHKITNDTTALKLVTLTDGSTVFLSKNSSINYEMTGKNRRQVYLDGEAIFSVAKNRNCPFYVYANGLTTKVLGTIFKISAYKNADAVKVEVSSGLVRVFTSQADDHANEAQGLVLTPNQKAVYRIKDLSLTRTVVEKPKVLVSSDLLKSYTYTNTPLSQIFEGLEQIYGIKMIYDKEKFSECRLNMVLSDESLFEKLELIGKIVEGRYNVIDGQVIFIGNGCSEQ